MNVMLRMQFGVKPVRPPTAWFIVGRTADEWLAELASWGSPLAAARLHVVPTSPRDRTPCGVLVLGAAPPSGKPSPRVLAYGSVGRRLRLPVEALLVPDVSETELDALLEFADETFVWHPQAGLVSYAAETALHVAQLLVAPQLVAEPWDAAVPGIALNAKLASLEPTETPTPQSVIEDGRGDIGSRPPDLNDLPPAPNEPASGLVPDLVRGVEQGLAKAAKWFADNAPEGASQRTWVNALGEWAQSKLGRINASIEAARNRELLRLMDLLKSNPDEGLRFALPFSGGDHRGRAAPSDRLGSRNVDFNLGQLRGGEAADYWDVPPNYQAQLIQRYRELAAREIALGRHRRAAYIFASLLNDLRSAASTLEDGGHFREAAVLYDQRLHQPQRAAECFKKGGHWAEALALYERLGEYETIGDLHARLEQPDEAAAAWHRAVEQKQNADDVLNAARILEHKLHDPDAAFDRLAAAWPQSRQAQACAAAAFQLLARHERSRQALALLTSLGERRPRLGSSAGLVDIYATQAREYPDPVVRERAADETRIVVAERLSTHAADDEEARRLVTAVAQLVPQDRLLPRDGHRFLQIRKKPTSAGATPRITRGLSARRELQLPSHVEWKSAVGTEDAIFVAGFRDRELVVFRTDWNGSPPQEAVGRAWQVEPSQTELPVALVADPLGLGSLIVHLPGVAPFAHEKCFATNDRFSEPLLVGSHRGLSPATYGLCYTGRESLHVVDLDDGPTAVVHAYMSGRVQMLGVNAINLSELPYETDDWVRPIPCLLRERHFCLAIGRNLCFVQRDRPPEVIETSGIVRQIIGSPSGTRSRLIVAMARGGEIYWGEDSRAPRTPFATEMDDPRIALTRDGSLLAASKSEIDVYSTSNGRLKLQHRWEGFNTQPLAVLTTRLVNRFAVVSADGRIRIFDLSQD